MADSTFTITDLEEDAQATALNDFVHFYLKHYRDNSLEILSDYRVDYAMNDINTYLFENRSFSPDQLIAGVLKNKRQLFLNILKTVDLPYTEKGTLKDVTWDGWYTQRYAQINQGL